MRVGVAPDGLRPGRAGSWRAGPEEPDPGVRLVKAEAERIRTPDVTDEQVGDLVRGNNEFAFEVYGAAGEAGGGGGNLVFSPYSISLAFSPWSTPAPAARRKPRWPGR